MGAIFVFISKQHLPSRVFDAKMRQSPTLTWKLKASMHETQLSKLNTKQQIGMRTPPCMSWKNVGKKIPSRFITLLPTRHVINQVIFRG